MEKEIVIREATLGDYETLLRFEQGVISAERPFDPTLRKGAIHYYDIGQLIASPDVHLIVAEDGTFLTGCGYARIEPARPFLKHQAYAYLGFMYIDPAYRGKGVNRMIIDALRSWCLSREITEMRLEVYHGNTSALRAYEKAGFTRHMIEMRMGL